MPGGGPHSSPEIEIQQNEATIADETGSYDFGGTIADGDGGTATGYATFTIQNFGKANLTISSISITTGNTTDFDLVNDASSPVAPSASTSFTIRFDPINVGNKSATVTVTNNDSDEGTYTFTVTGTATAGAEPEIIVRQGETNLEDGNGNYIFETILPDGNDGEASSYITFTIENLGTADLTIDNPTITGSDFDKTDPSITTIAPASSTTFTIRFDPLTVGNKSATVTVNNNDTDEGVYTFTVAGEGGIPVINELRKITSDNPNDWDFFGYAVAIQAEGEYAIIGASKEEAGGVRRGAAYIFYRNAGGIDGWGFVKKLTASDAEDEDGFGHSVALDGGYALVGSPSEDGAGDTRGAAYIFYKDEGGADNWGEVKKITASDTEDEDYFGEAVALSGNVALVGVPWKDDAGTDRGAAYIFYKDQGGADNWGEVKEIIPSDIQSDDNFGNSVSIDGNYALVGSPDEGGAGTRRGAAYLFYKDQGGPDKWGESRKLAASDAENSDIFGFSVSICGDYVIVGAQWENGDGGDDRGAAYLFKKKIKNMEKNS